MFPYHILKPLSVQLDFLNMIWRYSHVKNILVMREIEEFETPAIDQEFTTTYDHKSISNMRIE